MKKKIMNNLILKIISVLIAVLMWLLIANNNDPIVTKTYTVSVEIQNSAYIESIGKTYQVDESQLTATVVLRGRSSLVADRMGDIQAVADLTQIVNLDTEPYVMVPITVTCERVPIENITVIPQNIEVKIEDVESKEFVITVNSGETTPVSGFEVGSAAANPAKINVSGPASLIGIIDRIYANIDLSHLSESVTVTSHLKIFDRNQSEFSDVQMGYLKFEGVKEPVVDVDIELWKVRDDVELKVDYSGSPLAGYEVTGVTVTPSKISVAGTAEALKALNDNLNTISIPAEEVDVSGQSEDFEVNLDLTQLLPDDIKLLSGDAGTAIVNVSIMPAGSKRFSFATTNIQVLNLDDTNLSLVFAKEKITVRVKGDPTALTQVNENTIAATIDLNEKEPGEYTVPVDIVLPEGCELLAGVEVAVQLVELK